MWDRFVCSAVRPVLYIIRCLVLYIAALPASLAMLAIDTAAGLVKKYVALWRM
jgi:hypothetical protein